MSYPLIEAEKVHRGPGIPTNPKVSQVANIKAEQGAGIQVHCTNYKSNIALLTESSANKLKEINHGLTQNPLSILGHKITFHFNK